MHVLLFTRCRREVFSRCFCVINPRQTCAKSLFCDFCAWVAVNGVNSNVWIVYHVIGHMNSLVIFCFLCYINNGDRAIALSFFYINRKLCLGWRCRLQHFLILLLPERLLFVLPTRKVFALHYNEKKKFVKKENKHIAF